MEGYSNLECRLDTGEMSVEKVSQTFSKLLADLCEELLSFCDVFLSFTEVVYKLLHLDTPPAFITKFYREYSR